MKNSKNIFDRSILRLHRDRAASQLNKVDFLFKETASRLVDKLDDINRQFKLALNLGCRFGEIRKAISLSHKQAFWVETDLSPLLARKTHEDYNSKTLAMDEELISFRDKTFDLVISNLSLHWVNDLPGTMSQIQRTLKPDGLFLAAFLGGDTLIELKDALNRAEIEIENGISPRCSPFPLLKDAGDLLVRSGFALPVADSEKIIVSYSDPLKLMRDLQSMGENNSNSKRRKTFSKRSTLMRAAEIYYNKYGDSKGRIPATFEVISIIGWAPHESQQKPMIPGSGKISLKSVLE